MKDSPKVLIHDLSRYSSLKCVPGVERYPGRAIVAARPQDVVVLPYSPSFAEIKYYDSLGICPHIVSTKDENLQIADQIINDEYLQEVISDKTCFLFPFEVTEKEEKLAKTLGIGVFGPSSELSYKVNHKGYLRDFLSNTEIPMPEGKHCFNLKEAKTEYKRLTKEGFIVCIKDPYQASGDQFYFPKDIYDVNNFWNLLTSDTAVVERWFTDIIGSFSIQIRIFPNYEKEFLAISEQIIEDGKIHAGNIVGGNIPKSIKKKIKFLGEEISTKLINLGWYGYFGCDFIVRDNGEVFLTEINGRVTALTYPILAAENLGANVSSFVFKNIKVSSEYYSIEKIDNATKSIKWNGEFGIVLYNTGLLEPYGKLIACAYAPTIEESNTILSSFENIVS